MHHQKVVFPACHLVSMQRAEACTGTCCVATRACTLTINPLP